MTTPLDRCAPPHEPASEPITLASTIRQLEPGDFSRAKESLASAFANDPVVRWSMRPDPRPDTLTRGMRTNVRLFAPHGLSFVTPEVDGVALWARHDQWQLPAWRELLLLPRMVRFSGFGKLERLRQGFDAMKARHPAEPHYYLFMIGVRGERQRRGLGHALVQPMLARCDAEGTCAYLEATQEYNVPFYRRLGFELREAFPFGPGGPMLWAMWREPRGRRNRDGKRTPRRDGTTATGWQGDRFAAHSRGWPRFG